MITIKPGVKEDIASIQFIAEKSWWPTYSPYISATQIAYMLNAIYSTEMLTNVINNDIEKFLILREDNRPGAFASFSVQAGGKLIKLNKLYVLPEHYKKKLGSMLLNEVKRLAVEMGIAIIELNVNRNNPAKFFYEKAGFEILKEEDIAIGEYWMNDYKMQCKL